MILIIVITCSDGAKPSQAERSTSSRGGTPTQSGCQPPDHDYEEDDGDDDDDGDDEDYDDILPMVEIPHKVFASLLW